jgi:hypothetical protein
MKGIRQRDHKRNVVAMGEFKSFKVMVSIERVALLYAVYTTLCLVYMRCVI